MRGRLWPDFGGTSIKRYRVLKKTRNKKTYLGKLLARRSVRTTLRTQAGSRCEAHNRVLIVARAGISPNTHDRPYISITMASPPQQIAASAAIIWHPNHPGPFRARPTPSNNHNNNINNINNNNNNNNNKVFFSTNYKHKTVKLKEVVEAYWWKRRTGIDFFCGGGGTRLPSSWVLV